eukprot:TRINITY_DN110327_c0_g1_i1.p1 TRINITY_DN110327_c0_g1~~TRINITY_DN110327_c0_g1_i1.p1  ORF type:complete len:262 (+),score=30.83 TRINITY_DN110327_c0_g1_i1:39-824(+)
MSIESGTRPTFSGPALSVHAASPDVQGDDRMSGSSSLLLEGGPPDLASDEEALERTSRRTGTARGSVTLLVMIIAFWQATVLRKYSKRFPESIFSGDHVQLNESCHVLFRVTSISVGLSALLICVDGILMAIAFAGLEKKLDACVGVIRVVEGFANLSKLCITVAGISVLFSNVKEEEAAHCKDLFICAWWCFLGLYLASAAIGCCLLVFLAGISAGLVSAQAIQSRQFPQSGVGTAPYGTMDSNAQLVQPFAGRGHRLSD